MKEHRHPICNMLVGVSNVSRISDMIKALENIKDECGDIHCRIGNNGSALGMIQIKEGTVYSGHNTSNYKELRFLDVRYDPFLIAFKRDYFDKLPTLLDEKTRKTDFYK